MIKDILKYQGNARYICILCINENDELIIFYALTEMLSIELNTEQTEYEITGCKRIVFSQLGNYEIKIPLEITKNNALFHIIKINDEKEYDHICSVVESLA